MKLFTKEIDKKLASQYHLGANLNAQVVVAKIFNPYGNGRWYLINSDPSDPDYLWAIVQIGDIVEVGSVSRKELENLRVGRLRFPLERDLGFSQRNAQEVYNGVVSGKTYANGGVADVTPTYAAGGINEAELSKFAEALQDAEMGVYDNLDIRSGGQLYRTASLQKQYASQMNESFKELTKKFAHLKDINEEQAQLIHDMLEDQNYHGLNNYLALKGMYGQKRKEKYEAYHTKYPDNYLDPANMSGAQSYAVGGLTPGRWYKDGQGVEYKFIGKVDSGPNKDQLLFTDGEKKMYKNLDDFGEKPKENKLFGFFENGGEIFKYAQNTFKDKNGVVHIDAYTTSEDDDDEDYDEDEGEVVAYVFPDGRVAYLDARAKYDKKVQKVIKQSGGTSYVEDLFEVREYLPTEIEELLSKYDQGFQELDYEAIKKAKAVLEDHGYTFDYDFGGGVYNLRVVDDMDSMNYMADGGKTATIDEVSSMSFRNNYDDYEMVVISKELDKDGGKMVKDRFMVSAHDIDEAKKIATDLWKEQFGQTDLTIVKVMSAEAYKHNYMGKMADGGKLNIGTIKKTDTDVYFDKQSGEFSVRVIDGSGNRVNKLKINTIDDLYKDYPTFRLNEKGQKEFKDSMADGGKLNYNDPVLMAMRAKKDAAKPMVTKPNPNQAQIAMLLKKKARIEKDMEQEAEFEGGPKADEYAAKLEQIDNAIKKLRVKKMAMGGTTKFADKVKTIQSSLLKRKKVAPSVQKDYGKTYNKAEAKEAATRIVGAMTAKERLMAKKKK
jgi:hypothetical protein